MLQIVENFKPKICFLLSHYIITHKTIDLQF